jgi:hypothetical protein
MNEPTQAQLTSSPNTGAKPLVMEDIYKLIGALHLEIEVLRRQNAHLTELLAAKSTED